MNLLSNFLIDLFFIYHFDLLEHCNGMIVECGIVC